MKKLLALLFLAFALPSLAGVVDADVDSTGPGFTKKMWTCHIQGQLTTDTTAKCKVTTTEGWKVLAVKVTCRARSGAASDATFDVTAGGTSILTAKVACDAAGTSTAGTLGSTTTFASGTAFAVDWDRNNSGTADDCDVVVYYRTKVASESF